jgi:hypothetical protein
MIEEVLKKQVSELLNKIAVFEVSFKKEVLEKMAGLDESLLRELKNILLETEAWQLDFIKKKLIEDPNFYDTIMEAKREAEHTVLELYKQKFESEDHKKMEIILQKIKEL